MATKAEAVADPGSCWNKAGDDEPVFVLRASDPCAPAAIVAWNRLAMDVHEPEKCHHAMSVANAMINWRYKHRG